MAVDPHTPARLSQQPPCRAKVRIRFKKGGALRLISHHDLMNCFERMFRRANLRIHTTQGFHPKPRMVFAQSLALGVVGSQEVIELELDDLLPAEEIHRLLTSTAPPGLEIFEVKPIDTRAKATVCRVGYRLPLPPEVREGVSERIAAFLSATEHWVERTRPQKRRLNIRPYIAELTMTGDVLEMVIWVTPTGTVRPDEVARALGLDEFIDQGANIERHLLELEDEVAPLARPPALLVQPASQGGEKKKHSEGEGRPTALVSGPLAFDS